MTQLCIHLLCNDPEPRIQTSTAHTACQVSWSLNRGDSLPRCSTCWARATWRRIRADSCSRVSSDARLQRDTHCVPPKRSSRRLSKDDRLDTGNTWHSHDAETELETWETVSVVTPPTALSSFRQQIMYYSCALGVVSNQPYAPRHSNTARLNAAKHKRTPIAHTKSIPGRFCMLKSTSLKLKLFQNGSSK